MKMLKVSNACSESPPGVSRYFINRLLSTTF